MLHAIGALPARADAAESDQRRAVIAELVEERRLGDSGAAAVDAHAAKARAESRAHRGLEAVHDAHLGQIWGKCREIWGRYGGDIGEI